MRKVNKKNCLIIEKTQKIVTFVILVLLERLFSDLVR